MKGCEAKLVEESGVHYLDITPKENADEGVISYNLKSDEFTALQTTIKQAPAGTIVRFKNKIFAYGSLRNEYSHYSEGLFYKSRIAKIEEGGQFDLTNAKDLEGLFNGCSQLADISALAGWNTANVTNFYGMFKNCRSLTNITALTNWNTSKVDNMCEMFNQCKKLESIDALTNWKTDALQGISGMFDHCTSIPNANGLKNWNISKVTGLDGLFNNCSNLSDISALAGWNTESVTDMNNMFTSCEKLTNIDALKNWKTGKLKNLEDAFDGCKGISNIAPLETWNTENVTSMKRTFAHCEKMASVDALKNWKTSNVTDMQGVFFDCHALTSISALKGWNTANVTTMEDMFRNCINLSIGNDLTGWDTSKLTSKKSMFSGVGNHKSVLDLSGSTFKGGQFFEDLFQAMRGVLVLNNVDLSAVSENELANRQNLFGNDYNHFIVTNNDALLSSQAASKSYEPDRSHNDPILTLSYGAGATMQTCEVSVPVLYDSRINPATGDVDKTKAASTDLMAVIRPQLQKKMDAAARAQFKTVAAAKGFVRFDFVPSVALASNAAPMDLLQTYYVASVKKETIPATMKFVADDTGTLAYKAKEVVTAAQDGEKEITTGALEGTQWNATKESEKEIKAKQDGVTKVGNKQVEHVGNKTITTTYDVDPATGNLSNPKKKTSMPADTLVGSTKTEVLHGVMKYEADETLPYNTQKKISDPVDGKRVTKSNGVFKNGVWVEGTPTVNETAAKDGLTKVGNKEVINNADGSVTTNVYEVNATTGALSNPKTTVTPAPSRADAEAIEPQFAVMYRLYNPYTHEHLFTTDLSEKDNLVFLGWRFESAVGYVGMHGEKGGVYRLYNPTTGEHHYTMKADELALCTAAGWVNEGVKFFSVEDEDTQVTGMVSMYNPYEKKFYHHYTSDPDEIARMVKDGWRKEEIKWYAAK